MQLEDPQIQLMDQIGLSQLCYIFPSRASFTDMCCTSTPLCYFFFSSNLQLPGLCHLWILSCVVYPYFPKYNQKLHQRLLKLLATWINYSHGLFGQSASSSDCLLQGIQLQFLRQPAPRRTNSWFAISTIMFFLPILVCVV